MATEVLTAASMALGYAPHSTNGQTCVDEIAELEKIVRLRDDIYAGKHPRFKPIHTAVSTLSQKTLTAPPVSSPVAENARPPVVRVPPPVSTGSKLESVKHQDVDMEISDVLLAKSDVLIKAENNLKRKGIERELKQQLENKLIEDRLKGEGRDRDSTEEDIDVEGVLTRALAIVNGVALHTTDTPSVYRSRKKRSLDEVASDNMSIDQTFYDEPPQTIPKRTDFQEHTFMDHDMDIDHNVSKRAGEPLRDEDAISQGKGKMLNQWSGALPATPAMSDIRRGRSPPPKQLTERALEGIDPTLPRGKATTNHHEPSLLVREASIRERPPQHSPQPPPLPPPPPRFSSIRNAEPVAPQPMRAPVVVNKIAEQDRVIDLREEEVEQTPRDKPQLESRRSSNVYIKPEPGTRPPSVAGTIRRSPSPERRLSRMEPYTVRRPYHEYPEGHHYHYSHPVAPPAHIVTAYEPYYRGASYAYPPPPPFEYSSRAYARVYPPHGYPLYDDYNRICHPPPSRTLSLLPPPPQVLPPSPPPRQPSRVLRRSPSPSTAYRRRDSRRHSRSLSPHRFPEGPPPLVVERALSRHQSRAPSITPSAKEYYERPMPPPPPPGHFIDPYHPAYYVPYPTPERTIYYEDRGYYPRPLPAYVTDVPPPPRDIREGSIPPRDIVISGYRERDYHYPPPSLMAPPPRPYPTVEYRAYRPEAREMEDGVGRGLRADGMVVRSEYARASSVRPERTQPVGYPVPPPQSSPYRSSSARPERARREYVYAEDDRVYGTSRPVTHMDRDHEYRARIEDPAGRLVGSEMERERSGRRYGAEDERGRRYHEERGTAYSIR